MLGIKKFVIDPRFIQYLILKCIFPVRGLLVTSNLKFLLFDILTSLLSATMARKFELGGLSNPYPIGNEIKIVTHNSVIQYSNIILYLQGLIQYS